MTIRDWPAESRPRERLLNLGAASLTDAELLAIFLQTGVKGQSALQLAGNLLARFGGLKPLLNAERQAFCSQHGLGDAKFVLLQAATEIAQRALREGMERGTSLTNPPDAQHYLQMRLQNYPYEVFAALFLDNRHRVIAYEELFRGTIDGASVHPREVLRHAIRNNAAAMIFAHNHPSGVTEPSHADEAITRRLTQALQLIDVRVLDHIIVGSGTTFSFAARGLL